MHYNDAVEMPNFKLIFPGIRSAFRIQIYEINNKVESTRSVKKSEGETDSTNFKIKTM